MKQPYRALCWTVVPYAVWTVWAIVLWNRPDGGGHADLDKLGPLAGSALLGLPFSLIGGLLGWALGLRTDDGLFVAVLLGGWAQYLTIGWFLGRGFVREQVINSLTMSHTATAVPSSFAPIPEETAPPSPPDQPEVTVASEVSASSSTAPDPSRDV